MLASQSLPMSIQRRLYAGLQIFGGGQFVMTWMNQLDSAPNTLTVIFLTVLAVVGLASAITALMYLDASRAQDRPLAYIGINALALAAVLFFVRERSNESGGRVTERLRRSSSAVRPQAGEVGLR